MTFAKTVGCLGLLFACGARHGAGNSSQPAAADVRRPGPAASDRGKAAQATSSSAVLAPEAAPEEHSAPRACAPADWEPRTLPPLLASGKVPLAGAGDRAGATRGLFMMECGDSPEGGRAEVAPVVEVEGLTFRISSRVNAGTSGRGWPGPRCSFEVSSVDSAGPALLLDEAVIPPFNAINAVARAGSAVWLSVGFNGYTREFPQGGNRVVALDVCEGRVVWQSADGVSNGGLLRVGDYLIAPYGFTSERRYVHVLNARSGALLQKLPVVEDTCPSKRWAPNWHPGERCDAPGQRVGAATDPRIEGGLFLVDTNTGTATFQLRVLPP